MVDISARIFLRLSFPFIDLSKKISDISKKIFLLLTNEVPDQIKDCEENRPQLLQ